MVKVDREKCIGCGLCANLCPEVFRLNAQNKSEAIKDKAIPCAKEAAENCPVGAISVK
jgi:ferredoxin